MSDAFRCDDCEEFYEGDPAEKLYTLKHIDRQGTDRILRAELCSECSESFAGGPGDE